MVRLLKDFERIPLPRKVQVHRDIGKTLRRHMSAWELMLLYESGDRFRILKYLYEHRNFGYISYPKIQWSEIGRGVDVAGELFYLRDRGFVQFHEDPLLEPEDRETSFEVRITGKGVDEVEKRTNVAKQVSKPTRAKSREPETFPNLQETNRLIDDPDLRKHIITLLNLMMTDNGKVGLTQERLDEAERSLNLSHDRVEEAIKRLEARGAVRTIGNRTSHYGLGQLFVTDAGKLYYHQLVEQESWRVNRASSTNLVTPNFRGLHPTRADDLLPTEEVEKTGVAETFRIFLAYDDGTGRDLAEHLKKENEDRQLSTFVAKRDVPPQIRLNKTWSDIIDNVIKTCNTFILMLSTDRLSSEVAQRLSWRSNETSRIQSSQF